MSEITTVLQDELNINNLLLTIESTANCVYQTDWWLSKSSWIQNKPVTFYLKVHTKGYMSERKDCMHVLDKTWYYFMSITGLPMSEPYLDKSLCQCQYIWKHIKQNMCSDHTFGKTLCCQYMFYIIDFSKWDPLQNAVLIYDVDSSSALYFCTSIISGNRLTYWCEI